MFQLHSFHAIFVTLNTLLNFFFFLRPLIPDVLQLCSALGPAQTCPMRSLWPVAAAVGVSHLHPHLKNPTSFLWILTSLPKYPTPSNQPLLPLLLQRLLLQACATSTTSLPKLHFWSRTTHHAPRLHPCRASGTSPSHLFHLPLPLEKQSLKPSHSESVVGGASVGDGGVTLGRQKHVPPIPHAVPSNSATLDIDRRPPAPLPSAVNH